MNQRYVLERKVVLFVLLALTASLLACGLPIPGQDSAREDPAPGVSIDSSDDEASVPVGAPVTVVSQVDVEDGVTEVQLLVNGTLYRRDALIEIGKGPVEMRQEWVPPAPGVYTLQVRMCDGAGALRSSEQITVDVKGAPGIPTGAAAPTAVRTEGPTETPTPIPTDGPTPIPTDGPTPIPTGGPTVPPTDGPTVPPTDGPTVPPTDGPTVPPTDRPTVPPTRVPTGVPTAPPTKMPTGVPTVPPTKGPTRVPTALPTRVPTGVPTALPTKVG
jgi:hypothetical protein